jgi:hypothetical protein
MYPSPNPFLTSKEGERDAPLFPPLSGKRGAGGRYCVIYSNFHYICPSLPIHGYFFLSTGEKELLEFVVSAFLLLGCAC